MKTSEKVDTILPALMAVKNRLQSVTKKTNNPFFKSKYADLNTYLDEVEPHLAENGLMLLQPVTINNGINVVSSIIMNKDGQFVTSEMTVVAKELDMQKLGSAITYARRYTLGSLLSMKAEDDDGNSASGKEKTTTKSYDKQPVPVQQTATTTTTVTPTERPSFRRPTKTATPATPAVEVESSGDDL